MSQSVVSQIVIKATPAEVYLAFTRSLRLEQWLCDFATVQPRPAGRMYLWWNGDFYSSGEYIQLEENKALKFKWHARFDPAPSEVAVLLGEEKDGTRVTMTHIVPDGEDWKERATGFKHEWDSTLPNLASLLETGLDRRTYDRPMLGIMVNDFNPEVAKSLGIPVSEGIRLLETIEGMGARSAGLQHDDLVIEFNGKPITNDFGSLALALQGKKGGDKVEVVFYRGPEKHTTTMELTRRAVPQIPAEPRDLAAQLRVNYEQAQKMLTDAFLGASEEEAHFVPAQGEWSAIQTLAHLVLVEREVLTNIDEVLGGFVRHSDEYGGNSTIHNDAIATSYGSVKSLLAEFKRLSEEVIAYVSNLPANFVAIKSDYLNLGNSLLNGSLPHTQRHVEQITNAILAARK